MRGAVLRSVKVSRYTYQVYYIGSSQWQPQYCDGNGCHNLRAAVNMLRSYAVAQIGYYIAADQCKASTTYRAVEPQLRNS